MKTIQKVRNKNVSILFGIIGAFVMMLTIVSCGKEDAGTTVLNVRLTDAPGDFQQVNIDIQGVEVKRNNENGESGWIALDVETGVYNLLELTNGIDMLLGTAEIPSGRVAQIRLILGSNNTVLVDDVTWGLATPSAQQSGLKLNVQADLKDGVDYTLLLDFDAAQSVTQNSSGYFLKPVIRVINEATSGAVSGSITPLAASPAVFVISGLDTLATSFPSATGGFLLRGIPAGTYSVSFNAASGYQSMTVDGVVVTNGNVTNLGTVSIVSLP